ncbi:MAG TPA: CAP domain-containing protein [Anaerolineae bacterium]
MPDKGSYPHRRTLMAVIVLYLALASLVQPPTPVHAQAIDKPSILMAINRARLSSGLAPVASNPALEKAAQAHSEDMAVRGIVDHTGTNGSSAVDRLAAAGYPAWLQTRVWAENVYAGSHGFAEALDYFLRDPTQSRSILDSRYREVGIGIKLGTSSTGTQLAYWTLDFGSAPNVLPVFINDGVTTINTPQAAIHLTQEEAVPGGEGNSVGRIIDIRISADAAFKDVAWERWEPLIPFTFDSKPGLKTVYVQMRDGGGRITVSTASVLYDPNATPQQVLVGPGSQVTTSIEIEATPVETPTPISTAVPIHTAQPTRSAARDNSNDPAATPTAVAIARLAPATAVPLPSPVARVTAPIPGPVNRSSAQLPDWLLPLYLIVQGIIVIAAVIWFVSAKKLSNTGQ